MLYQVTSYGFSEEVMSTYVEGVAQAILRCVFCVTYTDNESRLIISLFYVVGPTITWTMDLS